jgi:hypothetical protein
MDINANRIAIAIDQRNLTVTAKGDEVTITGRTDHIDALVDRLAPVAAARPCANQLSLFDAAEFEVPSRLRLAG